MKSLLPALLLLAPVAHAQQAIKNPYHEKTAWKLWRADATPVEGVNTLTGRERAEKRETITLAPTALARRLYPVDSKSPWLRFAVTGKESKKYAGMWDDVYASWSGLHGYVRDSWQGPSKAKVAGIKAQIMHIVDLAKDRNLTRLGINFYHQSTTGMGHALVNGSSRKVDLYEKIYFTDALICAPAHASYTETKAKTTDLYLALTPHLFHSVGSSNSETMAITKMIVVGANLPPATKLLLKRHGLYPSALLYLWKSCLPVDAPYGHELRQRIAYNAAGSRKEYPGRYGYAGSNRGDASAAFHRYDDEAHMKAMVAAARAMTVAPPEAILDGLTAEGGRVVYAMNKAALILQESGPVTVKVSAAKSYDLQDRPLTFRWRLITGDRRTTVASDDGGKTVTITVPHDAALPEGRTSIALIANNGASDGNPAIVTVFRKRGDLPPSGLGPKDYKYQPPTANTRPVILDAQDVAVRPGREATLMLRAVDREGFPLTYHLRPGSGATLDGNALRWKPARRSKATSASATVVISDGTSGNSYAGRAVRFVVAPKVHAYITADKLVGKAPLKVKFSAKGSVARGRFQCGWSLEGKDLTKVKTLKGLKVAKSLTHTFTKPGAHTVTMLLKAPGGLARTRVTVWVTAEAPKDEGLVLLGNHVRIADGAAASEYAGTALRAGVTQRYTLINRTGKALSFGRRGVSLSGDGAKAFKVTRQPRDKVGPGDSTTFEITRKGEGAATVTIKARGTTRTFAIASAK